MSNRYQKTKDVPTDKIIDRLKELSDAVAGGRVTQEREFTMRIPAECDRDADLVLSEAAMRLEQAQVRNAELQGALNRCVNEMQGGDYSEVGYSAVEQAGITLSKTPAQSLADIEARAVEKAIDNVPPKYLQENDYIDRLLEYARELRE